jgi:NAD(P)-dependent dehydrogenase (short-subunit alcohol dehydrogenase family)
MASKEARPYNEGMKLSNKIAVITGGSSGIGLAVARRFVDEGAHVFITGRRQAELDAAARAIGRNVTTVRGDATSLDDLDRLFAQIKAERGRLDVVVANAGMNAQAVVADASPAHYDAVFDVNVRGVFFTVQKALPLLADGGSIVLVASAMHGKGLAGYSAYSASKAAVRSFARSWAAELAARKIRVNSLSPGAVDTALLTAGAADVDALKAMMATWIPMGRVGRPDELAAAALFLASGESSFATGSDLVVDGGYTQL